MNPTEPLAAEHLSAPLAAPLSHSFKSGLSWSAVFAGAAAAAALSFILIILGFGLGLSAVSPWTNVGASAATIGMSTVIWLTLTQIAASGLGGYLSGRLRHRWIDIHVDEVYFRDTAHGLLAWAIATLATVTLLTGAIGTIINGGVETGANAVRGIASTVTAGAGQIAATQRSEAPTAYFVDTLFRTTQAPPGAETTDAASRAEAGRIFANALRTGSLDAQDKQYIASVVVRQTGIDQATAQTRVNQAYDRLNKTVNDAAQAARQAADKARKAAAYSALWMFVALLCGAFFASLFALQGGKRRDHPSVTVRSV